MRSFFLTNSIKTIVDEFTDHFCMKVLSESLVLSELLVNFCPFCIIHAVHALCFTVYQLYNFFTKVKGNLQYERSYPNFYLPHRCLNHFLKKFLPSSFVGWQ